MASTDAIEIVPAILKKTWEGIQDQWAEVVTIAPVIQIDITDGIFAGDGTFRDLSTLKKLPASEKIELHLMVHTPEHFEAGVRDLNPARCIFHIESFTNTSQPTLLLEKLRETTSAELALAINPDSPTHWLTPFLEYMDYVLFMGYKPGFSGQPVDERVFNKIREFSSMYPDMKIAVDGHVDKATIPQFVSAGARQLCANSAIFKNGHPKENMSQLRLVAEQTLSSDTAS